MAWAVKIPFGEAIVVLSTNLKLGEEDKRIVAFYPVFITNEY